VSTNFATSPESDIDWEAAVNLAAQLGRGTLQLVAERDAEGLQEWCLRMVSAHVGEGNALRSMSYFELAVVAGYRPAVQEDRRWRDLLEAAQGIVAEVTVKAAAEKAAEAAKAAEERARAEAEKAAEDARAAEERARAEIEQAESDDEVEADVDQDEDEVLREEVK
jgi:hypothetical protein